LVGRSLVLRKKSSDDRDESSRTYILSTKRFLESFPTESLQFTTRFFASTDDEAGDAACGVGVDASTVATAALSGTVNVGHPAGVEVEARCDSASTAGGSETTNCGKTVVAFALE
jgi:hypothetical protein